MSVEEVPVERTSRSCLSSFSIERQVGGVSSLAEKTDFVRCVQSMLQKHYSPTKTSQDHTQKDCWQKDVCILNSTKVQRLLGFSFIFVLFPF